jgi:hypothetical protein
VAEARRYQRRAAELAAVSNGKPEHVPA